MKSWVAVLLLTISVGAFAQQHPAKKVSPLPLPFRLTSDGNECSGNLHVTKNKIVWEFSWVVCEGEGWSASEKDGEWIIRMHQTPAEAKSCPMSVLEMSQYFPEHVRHDPWAVLLYRSLAEFNDPYPYPYIGCPSMHQ